MYTYAGFHARTIKKADPSGNSVVVDNIGNVTVQIIKQQNTEDIPCIYMYSDNGGWKYEPSATIHIIDQAPQLKNIVSSLIDALNILNEYNTSLSENNLSIGFVGDRSLEAKIQQSIVKLNGITKNVIENSYATYKQ